MFDIIKTYQVGILTGCSLVCLLLSFFIMMFQFNSIKKKRALIRIQIGVAVLLAADAFAYGFDGAAGPAGLFITRLSNFMVFLFTLLPIMFLNEYITALFMESGRFEKLPLRLRAGFILPCAGIALIVISQLTGIYYYIDDMNVYHRGPLFLLGYLIPFVTMLIQFSFVIQNRRIIKKSVLCSVIMFCVLPLIAAVIQGFVYGISFINIATWLAALTVFCFAITDLNHELAKAASTEATSGLPNAYGFIHEVERIINYHDPTDYCGFYFDIVRMSLLNNKFGKKLGDEIIIRYASYIRKRLDKDEVLGRLGGNYFVAMIKKPHTYDFLAMLQDVPVDIKVGGQTEHLHIAAKAGCYEINSHNISSGQLLSHISTAVSHAKSTGKPYVFMDEDLQNELRSRRQMEENCRNALKNKEFEPFYQPKVNVNEKTMCGAEALARWRHDDQMISPYEFIPIMEKNGSICELDFYILEYVCRDIRNWLDRGMKPVAISVNFSRRNLDNPSLAEEILAIIRQYSIPEDLIQIEVTETLYDHKPSSLIHFINELHNCGLTAAIDDFGTGSSSIKLMKEIPFDMIKIDKSFIDYSDQKEKRLLQNIIKMATDMDTLVLAEGVETTSTVNELLKMGCPLIQGYVFDKPLEKKDFEKRLSACQY